MSKEEKIVGQCKSSVSKELMENLLIEFDEMGFEPTTLCDNQSEVDSFRNRLKQVLDYLKAIDNANPSEALECLEEIGKTLMSTDYETLESKTLSEVMPNYYRKCKQALIKSQELEKVLEIIKKKHVSVWRFRNIVFGYEQKQNGNNVNDTYEYYTHCFGYYHEGFEFELLTEEEFDMLKRYFDE